ncbi:IS110 family transposase [Brevundimonas sp. SL130]|uniref:IS110 family transposase n=1 Tax=Brevundimonas sp. SL130 TaxID=2995143 RepID=UPI00226CA62E|nr:IS110 family transposase [Brevundimonas sp. SL130]WAC59752.1 IS110 family transposase [Brevundimonas sp. SL130]WAC59897.1 IS110 family transposase [Brevundimonas sp. SL130]WAC60391.1 IS110 family transposase [Brevundimonas sp. SL130]
MNIAPGIVGIDISKRFLDVFDPRIGRPERVANTEPEIQVLALRLAASGDRAVFEATGVYDRILRRALESAGVGFSRVDPSRARAFARAAGFLAKTDAVDARMLAAMGQALQPRLEEVVAPARERLAGLNARRDQLVAMRAQERNRRAEHRDDPDIQASLDQHLDWLDAQVRDLDARIRRLIAADLELRQAEQHLRSVPGVGPVAAATLLARVPELGRRSPKAIAALVGLAPFNADSGARRGHRAIRGGRKRVRDALYMSAVTAARSNTVFSTFYSRLRDAGKPPKVALVAVARKLLTTLNAIARTQTPFKA